MNKDRPKLKRPSHGTVVAYLALFVALGGSAYAASHLGKNSVGTKQLKKNAVTGAKVKDQSLTGKDINLAKLGTVPSATHAASADSIPPAEPIHLIGAPGQPGFDAGATNAPSELLGYPPAGFYKDPFGIVHLEGVVKVGSTPVIFTLPPGYRPASGTIQVFEQSKGGAVYIFGSADAEIEAGAVLALKEIVLLSGITYRAGS